MKALPLALLFGLYPASAQAAEPAPAAKTNAGTYEEFVRDIDTRVDADSEKQGHTPPCAKIAAYSAWLEENAPPSCTETATYINDAKRLASIYLRRCEAVAAFLEPKLRENQACAGAPLDKEIRALADREGTVTPIPEPIMRFKQKAEALKTSPGAGELARRECIRPALFAYYAWYLIVSTHSHHQFVAEHVSRAHCGTLPEPEPQRVQQYLVLLREGDDEFIRLTKEDFARKHPHLRHFFAEPQ